MDGDGNDLTVLVDLEEPLLTEALVVGPHPPEDVALDVLERRDPLFGIDRPARQPYSRKTIFPPHDPFAAPNGVIDTDIAVEFCIPLWPSSVPLLAALTAGASTAAAFAHRERDWIQSRW